MQILGIFLQIICTYRFFFVPLQRFLKTDMRKKLIFGLLVLVAMGFVGCKECHCDDIVIPPCEFNKHTKELPANQWEFDASANMYFCHFEVPELTAQVYNYGEVSVNREYNSGKSTAYQVALPETTYQAIELDNGDGTTSPYYYCQHIDYAYGIGFVEVFITISDFYYDDFVPEQMHFRMQLTW